MQPNHREAEQKFADKIAIAHGIETVLTDAGEAELARNQFTIENDGGTGERTGSERQNVGSFQTIAETLDIASKRFDLA
jgi:hypothetical protein